MSDPDAAENPVRVPRGVGACRTLGGHMYTGFRAIVTVAATDVTSALVAAPVSSAAAGAAGEADQCL